MEKFNLSLDSLTVVADAMTQAKNSLTASPEERFNNGMREAICAHIKTATTEALNHKSKHAEAQAYTYVAPFNKALVELLNDTTVAVLCLYGIDLKKTGSIQITFRF